MSFFASRTPHRFVVPTLAIASLVSACSASREESDTTESDVVVQPTNGSTEFVVHAPAGSAPTKLRLLRDQPQIPPREVALGTVVTTTPGRVRLDVVVDGYGSTGYAPLDLARATRSTVNLGGVRFRRKTTDRVAGIDILRCTHASDLGYGCNTPALQKEKWLAERVDTGVVVPEGTETPRFSFGPHSAIVAATDGTVVDAFVDETFGAEAIRIRPPSSRAFPDVARAASFNVSTRNSPTPSSYETWRSEAVGSIGDRPLLVILPPQSFARYGAYRLPTALHDATHPLVELAFRRLDVDDVALTSSGGTSSKVEGTFRAIGRTSRLVVDGATKHGVDVPPDVYDVETTYRDPEDGIERVLRESVDLR